MDLILYNGKGYTMDDTNPLIEAIAIKGNKIQAVGTNNKILLQSTENTVLINLNGHCFIPGFNDSHLHLYGTGVFLSQVNLLEVDSILKIKSIIRKYIDDNKEQAWIIGRGWNQDYFTDEVRYLTRSDLDEVDSNIPIVMKRACGHMLTANSKAIELAGITKHTKITGGSIDFEKGIFTENAIELIMNAIPEANIEQVKDILVRGMKYANSYGITSLQTDDLDFSKELDKQIVLQAYLQLQKEFRLSCRIYEQVLLPDIDKLKTFIENGYHTGVGDEFFKIGPLKLLADGSLGARTAALSIPYHDEPTTKGLLIYSNQELKEIITYAHQMNMQIAVHCIGDAAMNQVIDIYEKVIRDHPRDHRHGIVHCQIMTEEIHQRFAANNLIAYIQPIFLHYDHRIVEERVGSKLAKSSYAFKSLLKQKVKIAIGTDSPIELINPFNNIYTAVSRKNLQHQPSIGWFPEESLTIDEALKAYTIGSSYASFTEDVKGKLAEGYLADIVILSQDLYNIPADQILSTEALMTIVDGRVVYEKDFDF